MGFDFGTVRIGVAIGQHITQAARPLVTLKMRSGLPDWDTITYLVHEWQPGLFVVGLPYHADGTPNTVTKAALHFSQDLQSRYQLPVETIDERLSSYAAKNYLKEKQTHGSHHKQTAIDALAAAIILESWFCQQQYQ
jgi:putative Holliday junction resolvase